MHGKEQKYVETDDSLGILKFEGIDTLEISGQRFITGLQDHQKRLLKLLGELYEQFFSELAAECRVI
ncbi:hypothetical protein K6672_002235 [Vibrio vulnificus]|nr:hypothetical protein [Vibrio vulnificus]EKD9067719.1 hypothetical protein [Vibrio vulnificus]